jgi:hypothetical protein
MTAGPAAKARTTPSFDPFPAIPLSLRTPQPSHLKILRSGFSGACVKSNSPASQGESILRIFLKFRQAGTGHLTEVIFLHPQTQSTDSANQV